jgi:hypothetical protein
MFGLKTEIAHERNLKTKIRIFFELESGGLWGAHGVCRHGNQFKRRLVEPPCLVVWTSRDAMRSALLVAAARPSTY